MAARNLTLARGRLYFAPYKPGTQIPGGERFVGNCSEVTINSETETLDHFKSTEGVRIKDDSVILENTRSGSIVTDDLSDENVSVFSLGIAEEISVASATAQETTFTEVRPGDSFQLGTTALMPAGVRKVTVASVTDGAPSSPVTYVAGTDYVVDADRGRITILEGGNIDADSDIEVTWSNAAYKFQRVTAGSTEREGALRWISANPKGPQRDYFFPDVKLSPNGDLSLVSGEDWATLPLSIEVLEKEGLAPWYADGVAETA